LEWKKKQNIPLAKDVNPILTNIKPILTNNIPIVDGIVQKPSIPSLI
jgi:hypothetical protein|tara:strand:+ start:185 stop:325 length:141 start_codon:yes stop_codon:yes gene_type:complete